VSDLNEKSSSRGSNTVLKRHWEIYLAEKKDILPFRLTEGNETHLDREEDRKN
jgi:hypothetical protein